MSKLELVSTCTLGQYRIHQCWAGLDGLDGWMGLTATPAADSNCAMQKQTARQLMQATNSEVLEVSSYRRNKV
jgi:hypothetical protein